MLAHAAGEGKQHPRNIDQLTSRWFVQIRVRAVECDGTPNDSVWGVEVA